MCEWECNYWQRYMSCPRQIGHQCWTDWSSLLSAKPKDRWIRQLAYTIPSDEEPFRPNKHSLTFCVSGTTLHWDENKQSTSVFSKTVTLASPESNSDPTNPTALNHNCFSTLLTPCQKITPSKQRKWVVPPKSEQQLRDAKIAREERKEIAHQKKLLTPKFEKQLKDAKIVEEEINVTRN